MSKGLKLRKEVMFRNSSLPDEFVTLGKLFDVSIPYYLGLQNVQCCCTFDVATVEW